MAVDWSDNVCVAHLADDPQFGDEMESLEAALEDSPRHAVLDLGGVTFVNSSNLAQLVGLRKQLAESEHKLILCAVKDELWRAFQVSRLDRLFTRVDSVLLALATLQVNETAK